MGERMRSLALEVFTNRGNKLGSIFQVVECRDDLVVLSFIIPKTDYKVDIK